MRVPLPDRSTNLAALLWSVAGLRRDLASAGPMADGLVRALDLWLERTTARHAARQAPAPVEAWASWGFTIEE